MNESFPIVLELETPQNAEQIYPFTQKVLGKILDYKSLDSNTQSRIKMILIELITNSIKHSSDADSQIRLVIDHPVLTIQKFEKGLQIEFSSGCQQIPFEEVDKILKISFSEQNKHQIQPLGKYKFKFLGPYTEELTLHQIPEHFGFYIITLASDSFIYQYNPETKVNQYTVKLNNI